jgi:hypothetical protein
MDEATAALVGAVAGIAGSAGTWFLQDHRYRAVRREDARRALQRELREEYVNFLTSVREVRYVCLRTLEKLATKPVSDVDSLLTELSRAYT